MDQVLQGGQYTGRVVYRTSDGVLVDPDNPYMNLLAPDGSSVSAHTILERDDVGQYHVTFTVSPSGQVGIWTMEFFGTINGSEVFSPSTFEVINPGSASAIVQTTSRIRMMLGEKIPVGGDESDTRFLDADIMAMYNADGQDFNKTMADLWMSKSAAWVELVDMAESGTVRNLSQMSKAALTQAKVYQTIVQEYEAKWQSTYRVPGRSIKVWADCDSPIKILWEPVTVRA